MRNKKSESFFSQFDILNTFSFVIPYFLFFIFLKFLFNDYL